MKKDIKFWLLIVIVAILMTIISVFVVYKYHIYKANVDANSIEVGDNEDLEETNTEDIENIKINEADLIGKLTIPDILASALPIAKATVCIAIPTAVNAWPTTLHAVFCALILAACSSNNCKRFLSFSIIFSC